MSDNNRNIYEIKYDIQVYSYYDEHDFRLGREPVVHFNVKNISAKNVIEACMKVAKSNKYLWVGSDLYTPSKWRALDIELFNKAYKKHYGKFCYSVPDIDSAVAKLHRSSSWFEGLLFMRNIVR